MVRVRARTHLSTALHGRGDCGDTWSYAVGRQDTRSSAPKGSREVRAAWTCTLIESNRVLCTSRTVSRQAGLSTGWLQASVDRSGAAMLDPLQGLARSAMPRCPDATRWPEGPCRSTAFQVSLPSGADSTGPGAVAPTKVRCTLSLGACPAGMRRHCSGVLQSPAGACLPNAHSQTPQSTLRHLDCGIGGRPGDTLGTRSRSRLFV